MPNSSDIDLIALQNCPSSEDRKWQLPFATMYNAYCADVRINFTPQKRRKVRPWKRAPEDDSNKRQKTVFPFCNDEEHTSDNDGSFTFGFNGHKDDLVHRLNERTL